jgi:hypothetical protein
MMTTTYDHNLKSYVTDDMLSSMMCYLPVWDSFSDLTRHNLKAFHLSQLFFPP